MVALVYLGKVQAIIQQKNVPLKTLKKAVQSSGLWGSKYRQIVDHAVSALTEWCSDGLILETVSRCFCLAVARWA
ncbi:hypothetical protein OGX94_21205 [Citrobacter sp. Cpo037]|uniref:hypothetical protein n=1 Tax=Citrobacter TaxID=544 RepID=UPI00214D5627|nr:MULTISPECIES: hypothetical protein [Citrobacter]MCR3694784.1 hypothetical protein [Citrobacter portucalensis]MDM2903037.1 hypothetical protein [Citrobacter sp. Cpo037]